MTRSNICKRTMDNNNNVYCKSNIQTGSIDCTYKLKKDKKYHVNVQVK